MSAPPDANPYAPMPAAGSEVEPQDHSRAPRWLAVLVSLFSTPFTGR